MPSPNPRLLDDHPHEKRVQAVEQLAKLMDSQFKIPGVPYNLGLDTIIGFIPVVGDTVGLSVSSWIILESHRLGIKKRTLTRMLMNVGLDWLIGLIPIIGDLFDWGWKANNKNAALLRHHFDKSRAHAARAAKPIFDKP